MSFSVPSQVAARHRAEVGRHRVPRNGHVGHCNCDACRSSWEARNAQALRAIAETAPTDPVRSPEDEEAYAAKTFTVDSEAVEATSQASEVTPPSDRNLRAVLDAQQRETAAQPLPLKPLRRSPWDVRLVSWAVGFARIWLQRAWRATHWTGRHYILGRSLVVAHVAGRVSARNTP